MSNGITGSNGPIGINAADTAQPASTAQNPLAFSPKDQGSTASELLRGQIGKIRSTPAPEAQATVGFRENQEPSVAAQNLMTKLHALTA